MAFGKQLKANIVKLEWSVDFGAKSAIYIQKLHVYLHLVHDISIV